MNIKGWVNYMAWALIMGVLTSCSIDDANDGYSFTYKLNPVVDVELPDTLQYNEVYDFKIYFEKPSDCYSFSGFDYEKDGNERRISVVSSVLTNENHCTTFEEPETEMRQLNFKVERHDYYIFKFWQGKDSLGDPQYLTREVIVDDND